MSTNGIDEDALICEHIYLAYWVLYKMKQKGYFVGEEDEEMKQEALVGLVRAAKSYDPERGTAFSTHAVWKIRRHLQEVSMKINRQKRGKDVKTYSLDEKHVHDKNRWGDGADYHAFIRAKDDTEESVLSPDAADTLETLIKQVLKGRHRTWFLEFSKGKPLKQIANEANVSIQGVSVSIRRNRAKLQAEVKRRGLCE